jgi:hypothetical protein
MAVTFPATWPCCALPHRHSGEGHDDVSENAAQRQLRPSGRRLSNHAVKPAWHLDPSSKVMRK